MNYIKRVCDTELQDKLDAFGAVHITGPKRYETMMKAVGQRNRRIANKRA